MKNIIILLISLFGLSVNSDEIKLYPSKIIAESFVVENKKIYGVEKLYDQDAKTSFSFGLIGRYKQNIIFYFDEEIELTSFEMVNGFQEIDSLYEEKSRVCILNLNVIDKYGNYKYFDFKVPDTKEKQIFNINLEGKRIKKIFMLFASDSIYTNNNFNNLSISEITFYGKNYKNLKINNNPKKLNSYFKSIKYNYMDDYSEFFKREIEYEFSRGGIVNFKGSIFEIKYLYPFVVPIDNNGLKGKYSFIENKLILYINEIFVSRGYDQEYRINWEPLKDKQELSFNIVQEGCFIKLIPDKEYDILKPAFEYIKIWKDSFKNAPKGDYIPIAIQ